MRERIHWIASILFYAAVAAGIAVHKPAPVPPPHPALLSELLAGRDRGYNPFGFEFEPFRRALPPGGRVSFLMDYPFGPYVKTVEKLYTAQFYLAPLMINPDPAEQIAIVYCSDIPTADRRMAETGYRLGMPIAEGKAIAVKKP